MTQLHDMTALEQAAAVRAREVSPRELVDHYLERIERLDTGDDALGAFITVTPDSAREQADAAGQAVLAGAELPPLHGVPTAIKDLNLTAGVRTTFGSKAFADFVPEVDDYVVTKLRAAGTISLGKTNTPELGLPCYTHNEVAPVARCPWDVTRYAGGSSGGAGTAVAAGLLPFAQGSDGGGSIRIPSSINGLYGIKPSRGLISAGPVRADVGGLGTDGPMARTVRDAAAMLDAMAGPMPNDLFAAPRLPAGETYLMQVDREPGRLRIGRFLTPAVAETVVDPQVVEAWESSSELLASLGHEIVDVETPLPPRVLAAFEVIWAVSAASSPVPQERVGDLQPLTQYLRQRGGSLLAPEYVGARAQLQQASWAAGAALAGVDVLLCPTLTMTPRPVGWFAEFGVADDFERQKQYAAYTAVFNVTGQPAVNVPLWWTSEDLPIGSMLVGAHGSEATLIALSAQLEAARPWASRHPGMW